MLLTTGMLQAEDSGFVALGVQGSRGGSGPVRGLGYLIAASSMVKKLLRAAPVLAAGLGGNPKTLKPGLRC